MRLPRPRSRRLLVCAARWLWTLPTNLIGHLAGAVVCGQWPRRIAGPVAVGWLYPIRPRIGLDWVGAVTLGNAILYRPGLLDGATIRSRLTLAHELAHTRQHDRLGPLYLPLHVLAQAGSALLSIGRRPRISRVHDHNPLEQTFICLSAGAVNEPLFAWTDVESYLAAFGV